MAAVNFPDPSASPWTNPDNGVTYVYESNVWRAVQSGDTGFVKKSGDDMTGDLTLGTDKITLNATDGSAEFKGNQHNFGEYVFDSNTAFGMVHEGGSLTTQRTLSTSDTDRAYGHRYGKDITIEFLNNGSASFAGKIDAGVDITNFKKGVRINPETEGTSYVVVYGTGNGSQKAFVVYDGENADEATAYINHDGSATFAGQISGDSVIETTRFGEKVQLGASTFDAFRIGSEATGPIKLKYDGSAEFAGTVTANGTILTRASGTLDVGDRLEKADNALQALKTAAAAATDFAALKTAIATALADI